MDNYLSIELRLERERRYLQNNPCQAVTLALHYLEDFLNLAREFRALEQKYQSVMASHPKINLTVERNIRTKSCQTNCFSQLPKTLTAEKRSCNGSPGARSLLPISKKQFTSYVVLK
jgi:hypothetical protein